MPNFRSLPRRRFLLRAAAATGVSACAALLPRRGMADELARLAESDATAAALGYREDGAKIDAVKFPTHKAGQACVNCKFFAATDLTAAAGCQLFPGKSVAAKGWCSAYNAKG